MVTTIDEEVLELCSRAVANTPTISPAIGFANSSLSENAAPVQSSQIAASGHQVKPKIILFSASGGRRRKMKTDTN